jgi:hypothetical protein
MVESVQRRKSANAEESVMPTEISKDPLVQFNLDYLRVYEAGGNANDAMNAAIKCFAERQVGEICLTNPICQIHKMPMRLNTILIDGRSQGTKWCCARCTEENSSKNSWEEKLPNGC